MEDIVPGLIKTITEDFRLWYDNSNVIQNLLRKVEEGRATYQDCYIYAEQTSKLYTEIMKKDLYSAMLPDETMYYNIAQRVLQSELDENYTLVSDYTKQVQQDLNTQAGLGLKAQTAKMDQDKADGIVEMAANAEDYDAVADAVQTAVETFALGVVDDTLKTNVEFQGESGLSPKVERKASSGACQWCLDVAGTYTYPNVPKDVYRRHRNCHCVVEYDPGDGSRQNVHTKKWTKAEDSATLEARKTVGLESTTQRTFQSQKLLEYHYNKHSQEYGTISIPDYLKKANELADTPVSEDVVELLRSDGSTSRYRLSTNDFVVINADGTIRTLFKPVDKEAYWQDELDRN